LYSYLQLTWKITSLSPLGVRVLAIAVVGCARVGVVWTGTVGAAGSNIVAAAGVAAYWHPLHTVEVAVGSVIAVVGVIVGGDDITIVVAVAVAVAVAVGVAASHQALLVVVTVAVVF
jgi:hypothetical protein